jgi:hypothetical protein
VERIELERRIAEVEGQLAIAPDGEARVALSERRLVLSIAVAELGRLEVGAKLTVEEHIAQATAMLAARRREETRSRSVVVAAPSVDKSVKNQVPRAAEELEQQDLEAAPGTTKSKFDSKPPAPQGLPVGHAPQPTSTAPREQGGKVEKARVASESQPPGLMAAVEREVGAMEACLGDLDGGVTLQVTLRLNAAGAVSNAKVGGVTGEAALCVRRVLQRVRVPDHDGGTRVVRFPLYFQR